MTNYRRGAGRELRVAALYEANGWGVVRSAGSHGPADLVCMKAGRQTEVVQVKSDRVSPWAHFGPAERAELLEFAVMTGTRAVLCWYPPDRKGPRYLHPQDWPEAKAA